MVKKKLNIKKKMPNGGKAPIKGTKEQYQAYQDSLDLFNYTNLQHQLEPSWSVIQSNALQNFGIGKDSEFAKNQQKLFNTADSIIKNNPRIEWGTYGDPFADAKGQNGLREQYGSRGGNSPDIRSKNNIIKPTNFWTGAAANHDYIKPVQPIIYEPEIINSVQGGHRFDDNRTAWNGTFQQIQRQSQRLNPLDLLQRPKEQQINIQSAKPDLLQGSDINMFNPIPFEKGTYFTRPRQSQELEQGKTDYFDKKTGKLMGTYKNGGRAPIKGTKEQDFRINTEDNSWLTKIDNVMSAPARGATYLLTGKYQDPSDALGIDAKEHPYLKLATDLTLDPMNLLGLGIVSKVGKGAKVIDVLNDGTKVVRELGKLEKPFEITQGGQKYVKNIYDVAHNAQQTNKNLKRFEGLSEVVENSEKIRRGQLLGSATASINDILVQNKKPVQPIIYEPEGLNQIKKQSQRINPLDLLKIKNEKFDVVDDPNMNRSEPSMYYKEPYKWNSNDKTTPISILYGYGADNLQSKGDMEFNPIPYTKGSYFTREQQGQEVGEKEYFDKKTGKKLAFGGNINELDMKKNGKKIKLKKALTGLQLPEQTSMLGNTGLLNMDVSQGFVETNNTNPNLIAPNPYTIQPEQFQQNPWQDVGQQMILSLDNLQNLPKATIPNITDSKWWAKADKKFQKGQELAVKAGQSVISGFTGGMGGGAMGGGKMPSFGKANGGFIPKKMQGGGLMSWLDAASYGTGAAASFAGAGMDTTGALLDTLGSANINNQVKQWENQNARQFAFNKAENLPPIEEFGYQFQGRNNALMEHGGMTKYKSYNNGGVANVEVENLETIATPQGEISTVYGDTHAEGGIDMLLPENTKVFSEKLKHPETKKSYAKMAKKLETKRDIKNMEYPFADTTSLFTSELNIAKKKELSDELFAVQEMNKIEGKHGKIVQNSTEKDYKMKYGGITEAKNGEKIDNNPTLKGTKKGVEQSFKDLDEAYNYYKAQGYKGKKDVTEMRRWDYQRNPQQTLAYIRRSQPTNKHLKIWKDQYSKTEPIDLEKMTPEEVFSGYDDNLWDFRINKPKGKEVKYTPKAKKELVSDAVSPITDKIKAGNSNFKQFMPQTKVPFYQFDSFQRDPITSYTVDPQYVHPRYLDINPELSDINRDVNAITALTPDRTGANIANIANIANQARAAKQRAFGQKYQYDKQQDQWAEGTNAQAKMTTDLQNLNNYIKNVRDPQLMRESIITQQKGINNEAELSRTEQYNRDANTMAWMDKYYNPSANSQMPIFDPYTGEKLIDVDKIAKYGKKIKLKAKIKKK